MVAQFRPRRSPFGQLGWNPTRAPLFDLGRCRTRKIGIAAAPNRRRHRSPAVIGAIGTGVATWAELNVTTPLVPDRSTAPSTGVRAGKRRCPRRRSDRRPGVAGRPAPLPHPAPNRPVRTTSGWSAGSPGCSPTAARRRERFATGGPVGAATGPAARGRRRTPLRRNREPEVPAPTRPTPSPISTTFDGTGAGRRAASSTRMTGGKRPGGTAVARIIRRKWNSANTAVPRRRSPRLSPPVLLSPRRGARRGTSGPRARRPSSGGDGALRSDRTASGHRPTGTPPHDRTAEQRLHRGVVGHGRRGPGPTPTANGRTADRRRRCGTGAGPPRRPADGRTRSRRAGPADPPPSATSRSTPTGFRERAVPIREGPEGVLRAFPNCPVSDA